MQYGTALNGSDSDSTAMFQKIIITESRIGSFVKFVNETQNLTHDLLKLKLGLSYTSWGKSLRTQYTLIVLHIT